MVISRRHVIAGMGSATLVPCEALQAEERASASLPNSSGLERPSLRVPNLACDSHIHIIDSRFKPAEEGATLIPGATASDYRMIQRRLGTTRVVAVNSKLFGTDNSCLVDAVQALAPAKGIAVVHPDVSEAELRRLDSRSVCGIRISTINPNDHVTDIGMIEPLAPALANIGWNMQLYMSGEQILANERMLSSLPCTIVFDHMGKVPVGAGPSHPAFDALTRLLANGRTWVKLAGAYLNTKVGAPSYRDATDIARALVEAAPQRLVWGSDWPHTTEASKPDDAALFDLMRDWAPDEKVRTRILVDNPAQLYRFS